MAYLPGQIASSTDVELAQHSCEGFNNQPCGKPAEIKKVGETDSFGSEFYFLCKECADKEREYSKQNPLTGQCDYCGCDEVRLFHHRDIDEGSSGPVYQICQVCKDAYAERLREEIESDRDCYDYDDSSAELDEEDDWWVVQVTVADSVGGVWVGRTTSIAWKLPTMSSSCGISHGTVLTGIEATKRRKR